MNIGVLALAFAVVSGVIALIAAPYDTPPVRTEKKPVYPYPREL